MKTIKRQLHRHLTFIHHRSAQQTIVIISALLVASIGVYFLAGSHASTTSVSLEAESGTVGSGAAKVSSTAASNGAYVQFGSTSTGSVASMVSGLKLINYYPSANSWTRMWTSFNASEMNTDFTAIQKLGGNAVRISIDPDIFGWPAPSAAYQSEFSQVVSMAQAHNLRIELTLFDLWGRYTETQESNTWATTLLSPYKDNNTIAFVELQNEIKPLDTDAIAWMQYMIPAMRSVIGSIPLTVSVTNSRDANNNFLSVDKTLAEFIPELSKTPIDFYDIHYYGVAGDAYPVFQSSLSQVGKTPLWIGETGYSSWDGASSSGTTQEAQEDQYVRTVDYAAKSLGLPPVAPWILQDFQPGQGGSAPAAGAISAGNFYGLLRMDGSYKPIATEMQKLLTTGVLDTSINGDFSQSYNGMPLYWQAQDATQGTLAWDGTVGHTALGSVSLSGTSGSSSALPNFQTVPVANLTSSARTVTASVWAKGQSEDGTNTLNIAWFDVNGVYISNKNSTPLAAGSPGWTQLSLTATAPTNAAYFQVGVQSAYNSGKVWFDDVSTAVN